MEYNEEKWTELWQAMPESWKSDWLTSQLKINRKGQFKTLYGTTLAEVLSHALANAGWQAMTGKEVLVSRGCDGEGSLCDEVMRLVMEAIITTKRYRCSLNDPLLKNYIARIAEHFRGEQAMRRLR